MNEKLRVRLGILLWLVVAAGFFILGVYAIQNIELEAELAEMAVQEPGIERVELEAAGLDTVYLARVDRLIESHIDSCTIAGAVLAVVHSDRLAYLKAYGRVELDGETMSVDARFDLASLTKPVATATSLMQLVDRGVIDIDGRVSAIVPVFENWADEDGDSITHITVSDLMSHQSGLPPYVALERFRREYSYIENPGKECMIDYICHVERLAKPRTVCRYSCLNYIMLGHIVELSAGQSLDAYARENIFEPLGMNNTRFLPDSEYIAHTAPTSTHGADEELRGVVHDPLAREVMAGVSGNAGLFSTAEDLAIFTAMLLNGGEWRGVRILSPEAVERLFHRPSEEFSRTLAWDRIEPDSLLPEGAYSPVSERMYSHNGATGTSIVLDRERDMAIILLTNRTHVDGPSAAMGRLRVGVREGVTYAVDPPEVSVE